MALPGRALSARPRARGSWAELCLCCARGPQGPPLSGSQPGLPTLVPPTAPTTLSDTVSLSALRRATAPSRVCAVCVCVCVCVRVHAHTRAHAVCTHACTHAHTSVHTHITHTCTHLLLPPRFAFAPWPLGGRLRLRRKRVWPPSAVPTWWSGQWQRRPGDRPRATQTARGPPAGAGGWRGVCRVQGPSACQPQGRKKLTVLQGPDVHQLGRGRRAGRAAPSANPGLRNPNSHPCARVLAPRLEQPQLCPLSANLPEPSGHPASVPNPPSGGCVAASKP